MVTNGLYWSLQSLLVTNAMVSAVPTVSAGHQWSQLIPTDSVSTLTILFANHQWSLLLYTASNTVSVGSTATLGPGVVSTSCISSLCSHPQFPDGPNSYY